MLDISIHNVDSHGIPSIPSETEHCVAKLIDELLLSPARSIVHRKGKAIRSKLCEAGFIAFSEAQSDDDLRNLEICKKIIELLHAGSLIVDDIQDGSAIRRGKPAVHTIYGVNPTLTCGNWLYFWPLQISENLKISNEQRLEFVQKYYGILSEAHIGQSLDVGVQIHAIDQKDIPEICRSAIRYKSGSLSALSLSMGGICRHSSSIEKKLLNDVGLEMGCLLQAFDDIGNFLGEKEPEKAQEDLRNQSPTWIWCAAAEELDALEFEKFKKLCVKPDNTDPFTEELILTVKGKADSYYQALRKQITEEVRFTDPFKENLIDIMEQLKNAYTS